MCGFATQFSSLGTELGSFSTLYYTMNVTHVLEQTVGGYFSSDNTTTFDPTAVGADMVSLLDPWTLWDTHGNALITDLPNYFNGVCATSCDFNVTSEPSNNLRTYIWEGPSDPSMKDKWNSYLLAADTTPSLLDPFTFTAFPSSFCPYEAENCIPLQYSEVTSLFNEYCLPMGYDSTVGSFVSEAASGVVQSDFAAMVGDLKVSWKLILAMAFGSLVIALIFLWVLRLCVGVFVWMCIGVGFLLLIASGVLALLYAQKCVGESVFQAAKAIDTQDEALNLFEGSTVCPSGFSITNPSSRDTIRIVGYVLFGVAGLYAILILIFRKRIKLAIAINKVASQYIRQNKLSVLVPSMQTLGTIGWWALWLVVAAYAITIIPDGYSNLTDSWIDDLGTASTQCHGEEHVVTEGYTVGGAPIYTCKAIKYLLNWQFAYAVFFLFWLNTFILGAGQMIVAGSVGVWYFTPNHAKGSLGAYPLRTGIRNTFIYHLGTVALGSLILAIMRMIRIVFFWVIQVNKRTGPTGAKGFIQRCILVPIALLFEFIHKLVAFLSRNAYIQTALMGTNFCNSCGNASGLIARNPARIGMLGVVSGLVEIVGLAFITAGSGFAGWALLLHFYDGQIKTPLLPVIVICLVGFGIGLVVLSLFSMSVAAILQCFIIDEELHKSEGGAKFTPALLQRFLASVDAREAGIQQQAVVAGPGGPVGGQPISIVQ